MLATQETAGAPRRCRPGGRQSTGTCQGWRRVAGAGGGRNAGGEDAGDVALSWGLPPRKRPPHRPGGSLTPGLQGSVPAGFSRLLVAPSILGPWPRHSEFCLCLHMASSFVPCVCLRALDTSFRAHPKSRVMTSPPGP